MKKITATILLVIAIVVFANLVSRQYFFRIDFTEDHQYTLNKATLDILKSLKDPVTVKAYFSGQLPPNVSKIKNDFEEMLVEYKRLSGGNIIYSFINPNEDEKLKNEAIQSGIQPVMINVREKDQVKQQNAFLGAVLRLGNQKEVIPFMRPGFPLEYELSSAIKKMTVIDKPVVGLLQGHGEPPVEEVQQVKQSLEVLYDVKPLDIKDSTSIPKNIKTIVILRPTDTIPTNELSKIDSFLDNGGNVLVAINRVDGDFQTMMGKSINTGLETWLAKKGISLEDSFLVDSKSGAVTLQQQQGAFSISSQVNFPFLPIISNFSDHPISKGLEAVLMKFASPVKFTGDSKDSSLKFTPIAFTSEHSGILKQPQYFNVQKQWTQADFPLGKQAVSGVLEKNLDSGKSYKITIITDGDFVINGPKGQSQQLLPDSVNFMVNSVDWMSDDTGLIDLRTKGIKFRPIDEIKDGTKTTLKYLNFLFPIILLVIYGLIRLQINRNKRIKRMQENYE